MAGSKGDPVPHVTYSRQYRRCARPDCPSCADGRAGHGPYWYAFWHENGRARSRYVGKLLPPGLASEDTVSAAALRVRTLGGFEVWRGEAMVPARIWNRTKLTALFTCLLSVPGYRLHRERLIELLWPGADHVSGAKQLRLTLHRLRGVLASPGTAASFIQVEGELLALCPGGQAPAPPDWLDASAFESAANQALSGDDPALCRAALARYTGDYLPAAPYDDWALERREVLRLRYLAVLFRLAELAGLRGETAEAEEQLRAVLRLNACHEEAAARLMGLLAAAGRRPDALQVYDELAVALASSLGVDPSPDLVLLRRQLLAAESMPSASTQLGTLPAIGRRTNLPVPLTTYVARPREELSIRDHLSESRLLTITGTGGCGKTRLALHVSGTVVDAYSDGVWLVELAGLSADVSDRGAVTRAMTAALGLQEDGRESPLATVATFLSPRRLLLLLDNCEHVLGAAASLVEDLLGACPRLQILATSRQRLGVPGEIVCHLASMVLPPPDVRAEELPAYEASALFLARAGNAIPGYCSGPENVAAIARICSYVDGIPLAIELAAARARFLPLKAIAARLDDCFHLLTGGPRTVLPRQRTLRATLDWSYALLDERERVLLRRLAVFAGGWTLEAAETVCGDVLHSGSDATAAPEACPGPRAAATVITSSEILDLLAGLADKSLVQVQQQEGETRYRFLEPTRHYAAEVLTAQGEEPATRDQHLAWCLSLAEEADPSLTGPEQITWFGRLEREHDNLRAALAWSLARGDGDQQTRPAVRGATAAEASPAFGSVALRLAGALAEFWHARGAAPHVGNAHHAEALVAQGLALARAARDWTLTADLLNYLGFTLFLRGRPDRAVARHEESLALCREIGDIRRVLRSRLFLGLSLANLGEYGRAEECLRSAKTLAVAEGDAWSIGGVAMHLGAVAAAQGHFVEAEALLQEASAVAHRIGENAGLASALCALGEVACAQNRLGEAGAYFGDGLRLYRDMGETWGIIWGLEGLAATAVATNNAMEGMRLLGMAERLREASAVVWRLSAPLYERAMAQARRELGSDGVEQALALGRTLPLDRTIDVLLGDSGT